MRENLVNLFIAQANARGDKTAVTLRDRASSYAEIWRSMRQVAEYLQCSGVRRGDRVGILLQNSPEYVAVCYGAWSMGAIVVALNTQASPRDVANWIRHSDAKLIFLDAAYAQAKALVTADIIVKWVRVDTQDPQNGENFGEGVESAQWVDVTSSLPSHDCVDIQLSDAALIIYTSGTTGDPKGVTLSHGNLAANTESIVSYLELTHEDSIVNVLPFFYSYGNSVLHTHLSQGATLHLENSLVYPHLVINALSTRGASGFAGVPSTYALLLSRVDINNYDLRALRYLTQAGGPMSVAHIERLRAVVPKIKLFVMYGQTEATARLSYLPPDLLDKKMGSAGKAIPGVTLEVRDTEGKGVARGVAGEIYARGENIMLGYWNNSAATREVIIDGWLKTGDLAYMDEDGFIYIHGRGSDIIKTGAYRVSPQEIEEVLFELPQIAEAAAVGVPDELMGEIIKVAIVLKQNELLDSRAVQAHCKQRLPTYKVPKVVEFRTTLPRTSSGKVRRILLVETQKEIL